MVRTSLDVVLRLRDDAERRARASLGSATKAVGAASARLQEAVADAQRGAPHHLGVCDAWLVAVSDHADEAALTRVKSARQTLAEACKTQQAACDAHVGARTAQRVIARVVDAKREQHVRELAKREQTALDDLAIMRA